DLEGLVAGAVLLSLLSHQTNVRGGTHGGWVVSAVFAAVFNNCLVNTSVRGVRDDSEGVLLFIVLVPHVAGGTDHRWHRSVDDDIGRNVQVGNTLVGVDHCQVRAVFQSGIESSLDFSTVVELLQTGVDSAQAVFAVQASLEQLLTVLVVNVSEECAHNVAEDDWVGDLHHDSLHAVFCVHASREHLLTVRVVYVSEVCAPNVAEYDWVGDLLHGGLQVCVEENALFLRSGNLCLQELIESFGGHESAVDNYLVQNLQAVEQNGLSAVGANQLDGQGVITIDDDGLLIVAEVFCVHGCNVGLGIL